MLRSPDGSSGLVWIFALVSMSLSVLFPLLQILVFSFAQQLSPEKPDGLNQYLVEKFPSLLIEEMRSWGQCLLFSLLLIIPGLFRLLQLLFVPFVVLFDPAYERGEVDALQKSSSLFRRYWLRTSFLVLLFYFVLPMITTVMFDNYRSYITHPFSALAISFIDTILAYIGILLLFLIFSKTQPQKETQEVINGSHV